MTGLAKHFGTPIKIGPYIAHSFPEPGQIAGDARLRSLKAGYREDYFVNASELLSHEILEGIFGLDYDDAKEALMQIRGVGPKVADCVLLFAYGHRGAFPIDTHVALIMREHYGVRLGDKKAMERKAKVLFGEQAGIMQQYLFHYRRHTLGRTQ
jgi:N-glycosylase/DNA lyase